MRLDHDYFHVPSQNDAAELKEKGDNDDEELGVSYTAFALVPPAFGFILISLLMYREEIIKIID